MNRNATVVAAAILLAGCASQPGDKSAGPIQVSLNFAPNPLRIGTERLVVAVADSSGRAINGADVSIMTSMPAMKMNVPMPMSGMGTKGAEYRAVDEGNGNYAADVAVTMATLWVFVAHANTKDGYGTAVYEARIGRATH